ncbi:recombinase family protein [Corynebacterium flavescens]|uniref:recombinase family protein n=1 Tax=Corynebacterium flavescens TaxID=28028 RepID=UPI003FD4E925
MIDVALKRIQGLIPAPLPRVELPALPDMAAVEPLADIAHGDPSRILEVARLIASDEEAIDKAVNEAAALCSRAGADLLAIAGGLIAKALPLSFGILAPNPALNLAARAGIEALMAQHVALALARIQQLMQELVSVARPLLSIASREIYSTVAEPDSPDASHAPAHAVKEPTPLGLVPTPDPPAAQGAQESSGQGAAAVAAAKSQIGTPACQVIGYISFMTTCAIYCRISDDKLGDSHGVDNQIAMCKKFAQQNGWTITKEYIDNDISAYSGKHRPEFEKLVQDMTSGKIERLVTYHVDRLARRMSDLARIVQASKDGNAEIHTIMAGYFDFSSATGEFAGYMIGLAGQLESGRISERVIASHAARVEQGKFRGAQRPPYGYDSAGHGMLTINEEEATKLRRWVDKILAGDSLLSIKRIEAQLGFNTSTHSIVSRLRNPAIAGLHTFKGAITGKAVWEPVIPEDKWRDVEAILSDPKRRTSQGQERKWQGSGVYVCGVCGGLMKPAKNHSSQPAYTCREKYCVQRAIAKVDEVVDEVIIGYLSQPENQLRLASKDSAQGVDVVKLRDERARLLERKNRLGGMFAEGLIDEGQVVAGTADIRKRLEVIESRLDEVREDSPLLGLVLDEGGVRERWGLLSPDKRAEVIRLLMTVRIMRQKKRGPHFDPESIRIEWK